MTCVIVIPIYNKKPTEDEAASLRQVCKILGNYPIVFYCAEGFDTKPYDEVAGRHIETRRFPASCFVSQASYSEMCKTPQFYSAVSEYDYMLIYQLDAWVFSDRLMEFCDMGYEYIGAPHYYRGEVRVGNGGFSLRKISKFLYICETQDFSDKYWGEDVAFSKDFGYLLSIPNIDIACKFALEHWGFAGYVRNGNELPFGCHAFRKWGWDTFWSRYINMEALVSIIIPCYNTERYVAEAIESVKAQTYPNWECVIVNDGSTDGSDGIILDRIKGDSRFKYIKQENQGLSAARNAAINAASGKYIIPLDADDVLDDNYARNAVKYLEENPKCAVYCCKLVRFGDSCEDDIHRSGYTDYKTELVKNSIFAGAAYRRDDFVRIGGYRTEMKGGYEDWEFWIRLLYHNDTVFCSDLTGYWYRRTPGSMIKDSRKIHSELVNRIRTLNPRIYEEYQPI